MGIMATRTCRCIQPVHFGSLPREVPRRHSRCVITSHLYFRSLLLNCFRCSSMALEYGRAFISSDIHLWKLMSHVSLGFMGPSGATMYDHPPLTLEVNAHSLSRCSIGTVHGSYRWRQLHSTRWLLGDRYDPDRMSPRRYLA